MINGGLDSRRVSKDTWEVYAVNILTEVVLGKYHCLTESVVISFSIQDIEHVTSCHDGALVFTNEINIFDVKRILVAFRSFLGVLLLSAFLSIGKAKNELKKLEFLLIGV